MASPNWSNLASRRVFLEHKLIFNGSNYILLFDNEVCRFSYAKVLLHHNLKEIERFKNITQGFRMTNGFELNYPETYFLNTAS